MNPQKSTMTVLAQIASFIPDRIVENLARKHKIQTRSFSADSHVVAMLYAHLAHSLSLNDVCDSLRNHAGALSQIRNCTPPSRNGLSHANMTRNADMAEELFLTVYKSLERQFPGFMAPGRDCPGLPHRFRSRTLRAVDSTTIQLNALNMGWAQHRRRKAAAKMHTALDMRSFLPNFVIVKGAKDSDPKTAWELCASMKDGEIAVFDKAYVDFKHLNALDGRGVFRVTRAKDNMVYEVVGQHTGGKWTADGGPAPRTDGAGKTDGARGGVVGQRKKRKRKYARKKCAVLSDERIRLSGPKTRENYPNELRLVAAMVEVRGKMVKMSFITNNFEWPAFSICQPCQCRWGVEVFFKELKQTLQLADFLGNSENAVRWQVWTALPAYLLLRFIAWQNKWRHQFCRLFTLLRAVLWNYFKMPAVIECCDTPRERHHHLIRGSPGTAYQPCFEGF
ncbi:MAG: IS4 family transposase [Victivallales bacterium]|nr:IS4 family transposase [Victivallales bacterium]